MMRATQNRSGAMSNVISKYGLLFGLAVFFLLFNLRGGSQQRDILSLENQVHKLREKNEELEGKVHRLELAYLQSVSIYQQKDDVPTPNQITKKKGKKLMINFGHNCCTNSKKKSCDAGLQHGADECKSYDLNSISEEFREQNKKILDQRRGAGYWLWKPYIILDALNSVDYGDIVMYTDAGTHAIASLQPLFDLAESQKDGIVLFSLCGTHLNEKWTKRDAFVLMDCDTEKCRTSLQYNAAFLILRKTPESVQFMKNYLKYASDERILTDIPNTQGLPNYPNYIDHRHDQSVLSLLAIREGVHGFHDPSQHGEGCKEMHGGNYDIMFEHTRDKS